MSTSSVTRKRLFIHAIFVLLLPIIVAVAGLSVVSAIGLVLLALLWRWAVSLSAFLMPEKTPDLILDTISASHFVEKVRWSLDLAGIEYHENASGGTLGAYFGGRTVPRLRFRSGAVQSSIGNSPEILRYLWGRYGAELGDAALHLEPTPERLALEKRCDRYGVNLQVWMYYHLLQDRDLAVQVWGAQSVAVPAAQRVVLRVLFPVLALLIRRSFRVNRRNFEKSCHYIEALLAEIDTKLADGRTSILGGESCNFTDYHFAAMCGLWLQPENYAAGKAKASRIERDRMPREMREGVERWINDYPRVVTWVEQLYAEGRLNDH